MRRVFYNIINNKNTRREIEDIINIIRVTHLKIIRIFSTSCSLHLQSSVFSIINTLTASISNNFDRFDQQQLWSLRLAITLTFRSAATSSALWPFDKQHHLQHFDLSISYIIIILWSFEQQHHHHTLIFRTATSSSSATTCNPQYKDKESLDHFWT